MSIILIGAPGSGKGTQGKLIEERLNYSNIIAGDLLRKERQPNVRGEFSELGKEITNIIDSGNLVSDEIITSIIKQKISELSYTFGSTKGFLFDGYPRTNQQARDLDKLYKDYTILEPVEYAIYLEVPEDKLIARLLERGKTSNRADDSNEEIIKVRMNNYHIQTKELIEYYGDKLITIDGDRDIEEVFNDVKKYISYS